MFAGHVQISKIFLRIHCFLKTAIVICIKNLSGSNVAISVSDLWSFYICWSGSKSSVKSGADLESAGN